MRYLTMETNKFHNHAWCSYITVLYKYRVPDNYHYYDICRS